MVVSVMLLKPTTMGKVMMHRHRQQKTVKERDRKNRDREIEREPQLEEDTHF